MLKFMKIKNKLIFISLFIFIFFPFNIFYYQILRIYNFKKKYKYLDIKIYISFLNIKLKSIYLFFKNDLNYLLLNYKI